jgi:2-polyprenyl-3-methyl-5-hydroxy-6-metoxy-1,4-benzoquinol methylase
MKIDAADTNMNLYDEKTSEYFSRARTEIEPLLSKEKGRPLRALEIGCSEGHTLDWLKKTGRCNWVAGVEPYAEMHPSITSIDQFFKLDVEKKLPDLPAASIDLILCLDVLEHLVNPWEVIRKLDGLLKPGGQLIVSVPNIRNYHILTELVFRGKFAYCESGILDRTHLRFFTHASAIELTETAGAKVSKVLGTETDRWQKRVLGAIGLGDLITKQFLLSAYKPAANT